MKLILTFTLSHRVFPTQWRDCARANDLVRKNKVHNKCQWEYSQQMLRDSYSCDSVLLQYWGRNKRDLSVCSAIFHWVTHIMSFWCYSFSKSYCSDCMALSVFQSWFACVCSLNYCNIFLLWSLPYLWHSSLDRSNRAWNKTKTVWKS